MSRLASRAAIGLAGLLLLLVHVPAASATLSVTTGATTATSADMAISLNATRGTVRLTCASFQMAAAIAADGTMTLPTSGFNRLGCAVNGLSASVIFSSGWTGALNAQLAGGAMTGLLAALTIPSGGLSVSIAACSFSLGGSVSGAAALARSVTPPATASVGALAFPATGLAALGLTVVSATGLGCAATGLSAGTTGAFSATASLSPAIVFTLL